MDRIIPQTLQEPSEELTTSNKHYITVDDQSHVVDGWSDGPHPERDTTGAICINEQGGYQFRLIVGGKETEENPALYTMDGIPLYKYEDGQAAARTDAEIAADCVAVPEPPPTALERVEAQVAYTAMMTDTLIEEV